MICPIRQNCVMVSYPYLPQFNIVDVLVSFHAGLCKHAKHSAVLQDAWSSILTSEVVICPGKCENCSNGEL